MSEQERPKITKIYHCLYDSSFEDEALPDCPCGIEMSTPTNKLHVEIDGLFRVHIWPWRVENDREYYYHPEWRAGYKGKEAR